MTTASKRLPRVTVTLPPELYQQVIDACEKEDLPIVFWARQAFRAKLKQTPCDTP
jgi:hypothetical protein